MKTRNKKLKCMLALAVVISLLSDASMVFAMTQEGEMPIETIVGCTKSFNAISETKAEAQVMATASEPIPFITSKITLKSAAVGSTNFSNASCGASLLRIRDYPDN